MLIPCISGGISECTVLLFGLDAECTGSFETRGRVLHQDRGDSD